MPITSMTATDVREFLNTHLGCTVQVQTANGYDSRNTDHRIHRFVRFDHSDRGKVYACFATLPYYPTTWTVYYDIANITHVATA